MHTLYIGDPKEKGSKNGKKSKEEKKGAGGDDSSGSLNLDSDSDGSDDQDDEDLGEGGQHADVIIIMEKADMKLQKIINKRKKNS